MAHLLTESWINEFFFIAVVLSASSFFGFTIASRIKSILPGPQDNRFDQPFKRIKNIFKHVFAQSKMWRRPSIGLAHFLIFWGFCMVSLGTIAFLLEGLRFHVGWAQNFIFLGIQDFFTVLVIAAVLFAFFRRLVLKPNHVRLSGDALFILGMILCLMVTDLCIDGASATLKGELKSQAWASFSLAHFLGFPNWSPSVLAGFHLVNWWIHLITVFLFLCYLPFSKHFHVITAAPNIFFGTLIPWGRMKTLDLENSEHFGVDRLDQLSWKQKLDTLACTECGRCSDACPATTMGKKLDPANIIINLRHHLEHKDVNTSLHGQTISEEELWACTTCAACMHACPLTIEHIPAITDMRRHLVLMEGKMPEEAMLALRNLEQKGNPWGISEQERESWLDTQGITPLNEGDSVDLLFWIGCAGSFDDRSKKIVLAMIKILNHAKISFGVIGKHESCTGDPARRIGNEYLFQMLVQGNVEALNKFNYKKLLTICPHCMNSLKHEYQEFGLYNSKILHHSVFIKELMDKGLIRLKEAQASQTVTLHDSCYLTRYNDIVDAPREALKSVPGTQLIEMKRHGKSNFCCGAGGGRMWMEEDKSARVNVQRAEEAVQTGAQTLITECPFCMTMMRDGTRAMSEKERADPMVVKDIAEWVSEHLA